MGDIEELVVAQHSYDVPPVVMIPLIEGLDSYLHWIDEIDRLHGLGVTGLVARVVG